MDVRIDRAIMMAVSAFALAAHAAPDGVWQSRS
jgi:hypothetical protein